MKGVYLFLADGFEDIEALGTRDVLIRGGVDVKTVSLSVRPYAISSRGLVSVTDFNLRDFLAKGSRASSEKDFLIFPGGMPGASNLGKCEKLIEVMNAHYSEGGSVAAICAAPQYVLFHLRDVPSSFTCYDGCEDALCGKGSEFVKRPFVHSERVVSGRGPGHTIEFALEILKTIKGSETAEKVRRDMILPCE